MSELVPWNVVERLEREWRVIDTDRRKLEQQETKKPLEIPRPKTGRADL